MGVDFREIPYMSQTPRRQGSPPLEGMYAVSPGSTWSFSDSVNQQIFGGISGATPVSTKWGSCSVFSACLKSSVCKPAVATTVLPKKDTARHPHAFRCCSVKYFVFLRKCLHRSFTVLWYWRVVSIPFIFFIVSWFSLQWTGHMHTQAFKAKLQPHKESIATFSQTSKSFGWAEAVRDFLYCWQPTAERSYLGKLWKTLAQQRSSSTMSAI